jgi:hypothetical protein
LCNFWGLFTALSFLSKESKSALSDWKGSNFNNRLKNSLLYIAFFLSFLWSMLLVMADQSFSSPKNWIPWLGFSHGILLTIFFGQLFFLGTLSYWCRRRRTHKSLDTSDPGDPVILQSVSA